MTALSRRELLAAAALALAGCGGPEERVDEPARAGEPERPEPDRLRLGDLERRFDATIGVYGAETRSGREVTYGADERFAFCSTFKVLAVGALLRRGADLAETVAIEAEDLVLPSPVTEARAGGRMTVRELCAAAIRFSDNTAANLLLRELGGPAGLQRDLRELGDQVTNCNRYEPELTSALPGDSRDTSTPRALAYDLSAFVLGEVLSVPDRRLLTGWLRRNTTGDALIRSAVPDGWVVGDKTGSGSYGTRNDIAVIWPPGRAPIVLAVMTRRDEPDAERDDRVVAEAARRALSALG